MSAITADGRTSHRPPLGLVARCGHRRRGARRRPALLVELAEVGGEGCVLERAAVEPGIEAAEHARRVFGLREAGATPAGARRRALERGPPPCGPRREPGAGGPRRVALAELQGRRRGRSRGRPSRTRRRPRVARTAARSAAPKSRPPVSIAGGPPGAGQGLWPVRSPVGLRSPARRARRPRGRGSTTPAPPAVLRWQTRRPPPRGASDPTRTEPST